MFPLERHVHLVETQRSEILFTSLVGSHLHNAIESSINLRMAALTKDVFRWAERFSKNT